MSVDAVLARISQLNTAFAVQSPAPTATATATSVPASDTAGSFASMLQSAASPTATAATTPIPGLMPGGGNAAIVAAAQRELGVSEQPPGSNDSPRIAEYRTATAGNPGVGPWCSYFVSWCARQAGTPIMDGGMGSGDVDAVYAWAQRTGRAEPAQGTTPRPGDLIVWDEHIGIVEGVLPDGRIQTIEGNSSNQVARRVHPAGDAIGYVRMS